MTVVDWLGPIGGRSDGMGVDDIGMLTLGGKRVDALASAYGTPLFVTVEQVLRDNARRIRKAFDGCWPAGVDIFYAIKTNNSLAIRAILTAEGIGGECFGHIEYRATRDSGVDSARIILNGSDKTEAALAEAVGGGSVVNIDSDDEIRVLERLATKRLPVRVNIRLRLAPRSLDQFDATFFKSGGTASESLRNAKWGFSTARVVELVKLLRGNDRFDLMGFSAHVGRFTNEPPAMAAAATEMALITEDVHAQTGFWPRVLDLGGGWPRLREPESRAPDVNPHDIGVYASAVTDALRNGLSRELPRLWIEPGRYLVGNAVVLVTSVTTPRQDLGRRWIHVDASTNLLMRIETSRSWYHILPASRMRAGATGVADIVGPTCIPSVLGAGRMMPDLQRGDLVAIPDVGMYAEVLSSQFNGMPRPAGVLVAPDGSVDLIRRQETYEDIYRTQCVPPRLGIYGNAE